MRLVIGLLVMAVVYVIFYAIGYFSGRRYARKRHVEKMREQIDEKKK